MALLQNFRGFAARNRGMNKNAELAESKINFCLNQNKIKKDTRQIQKTRLVTFVGLEKRNENFP